MGNAPVSLAPTQVQHPLPEHRRIDQRVAPERIANARTTPDEVANRVMGQKHQLTGSERSQAHIYFPEDSIGSVVANTPEGWRIEVGLFGREGMSGTAVVLESDRSPHESFIQVAGSALRMGTDELRRAVQQSPSLHQHLLRYVEAFQVQVSHTALSHGSYTLEQRLARWLLMCRDRLDGDDLPLVHEFLSIMLGVQRPGVTVALQKLEADNVICTKRGLITITDRGKLEDVAGGSYGVPEAEYRRLIGAF